MARLKGAGLYHHIYAWGNDRHPTFKSPGHYEKYLGYLERYCRRFDVDAVAYALMEWHVHLFLFDRSSRLSQFMESLHGQYARYFNHVCGRVGHVFGKRFDNRIVQANDYGLWLSRYVHRQPVEAGLVKDPKDYPWTSYRSYVGIAPLGFLKPQAILDQFEARGAAKRREYERFVLGTEQGSVDWADKDIVVAGDARFRDRIGAIVTGVNSQNEISRPTYIVAEDTGAEIMQVASLVSRRLGVALIAMQKPQGWLERRARHRVFSILSNEYGYSMRKIARAFNVSVTAVAKSVRHV